MINGIDGIALTKLDVLDDFEEIPICTGYKVRGTTWKTFPAFAVEHGDFQPEFRTMKGWRQSTVGVTSYDKLPEQAKDYVRYVEDETGTPVTIVSTGPRREETIVRT